MTPDDSTDASTRTDALTPEQLSIINLFANIQAELACCVRETTRASLSISKKGARKAT